MFLYQLETKESDKAFLAREIVRCPATVPLNVMLSLQPETEIVVQLSNKAKYKAVIQTVQFPDSENGVSQGWLYIIRK